MNREQRRAVAKAEKKGKVTSQPVLTDRCKEWMAFCEKNNLDFNAWFIAFSGWLNLTKDEKSATVIELVSQGKIVPDQETKKEVKTGWHKLDDNGEVVYEESEINAEQNSEGE